MAEGRVRGAPHQKRPLTPDPSPSVGRGENGKLPPHTATVAAAVKTIKSKLGGRHAVLAAAVRAAMVPVKHTIVVAEEK